jgi:dihydrolipoamide dehydrogenase
VGATFTRPDVQELLHEVAIAIVGEVPLETLWHGRPAVSDGERGPALTLLEEYGL